VNSPATNTGDGGADFFLGLDYQYGRGVSTGAIWQQTSDIIGVYAQDTWRVTNRLTLNLGLRYDAHTPWVESSNHQANYNFATGNIDLAGQNGASQALLHWDGCIFAPPEPGDICRQGSRLPSPRKPSLPAPWSYLRSLPRIVGSSAMDNVWHTMFAILRHHIEKDLVRSISSTLLCEPSSSKKVSKCHHGDLPDYFAM